MTIGLSIGVPGRRYWSIIPRSGFTVGKHIAIGMVSFMLIIEKKWERLYLTTLEEDFYVKIGDRSGLNQMKTSPST